MNGREKLHAFGLLWLRVLAGAGIATHGYPKIFGGWMPKFAEGVAEMGFPAPILFAWAAALSEFVGGILLILGLGTRFAALMIFCTMSVAAFIRHAADPFAVKEMALLYGTVSGAVIFLGAGAWSLDGLICRPAQRGQKSSGQ
jgi:putative oxidoreductase